MPNFGQFPQTQVLLSSATVTTNSTSAALTLPPASSYRFAVTVNTVSGTSPTLQTILATSYDGGTTYQEILSFSQITTTGTGRQMLIRPYMGVGDTATEQSATLLGTADIASGVVVNNGPINPQFVKVRYVVSGTSPSFSTVNFAIYACAQDISD